MSDFADSAGQAVLGEPQDITAFAMDRTDAADNYILSLAQTSAGLIPPVITPVFPTPTIPPIPVTASPPTLETIAWVSPAVPSAFTGTLEIDQYMPAPFDEDPPVLVYPGIPAPFSGAAPEAPGINLQFDYPDLTVSLPVPPDLLSLSTITFDGVTMPDLPEDVPVLTLVAPSVLTYTPGSGYSSSLLTALQATLLDRITNGGTGLSAAAETAIWDRGREREARSMADAIAELDRMESLGYAFPPGVFLDARLRIQTEFGYTSAGISREVMIKQAELEQTNVLQALNTSVQLEGSLITYNNQVEQRLFDSTKFATEAGIEIYNAGVRAYAAYLDAYKTKIAIYEAQIRGELANVEAYKAQIQAEEAKAQINTALVAQYKVQADVALSSIEVYKAQIQAIMTRAEVEKIKVQTFGEQVRAYGSQINAFTAGVEAYRASISAEGTKQEVFRSQVMAYTARVEAAAKTSQVRIEEFKGLVAAKTAEWDGFRAQAQAEASRAQSIAASNTSVSESYRATIAGLSSYNDVLTKQWQVALDQAERVAEVGVSAAKANAELYMTTRSLALDAAKVGAQVSAQLGAAALNAIHWSQSYSSSGSTSYSQSRNENYNYSV